MNRNPYRPRLLPDWLRDLFATTVCLLAFCALIGLAIYGYAVQP